MGEHVGFQGWQHAINLGHADPLSSGWQCLTSKKRVLSHSPMCAMCAALCCAVLQLGWRPAEGRGSGIGLRSLLRRLQECPVNRELSGKQPDKVWHGCLMATVMCLLTHPNVSAQGVLQAATASNAQSGLLTGCVSLISVWLRCCCACRSATSSRSTTGPGHSGLCHPQHTGSIHLAKAAQHYPGLSTSTKPQGARPVCLGFSTQPHAPHAKLYISLGCFAEASPGCVWV